VNDSSGNPATVGVDAKVPASCHGMIRRRHRPTRKCCLNFSHQDAQISLDTGILLEQVR
jgi:hypothetical protein